MGSFPFPDFAFLRLIVKSQCTECHYKSWLFPNRRKWTAGQWRMRGILRIWITAASPQDQGPQCQTFHHHTAWQPLLLLTWAERPCLTCPASRGAARLFSCSPGRRSSRASPGWGESDYWHCRIQRRPRGARAQLGLLFTSETTAEPTFSLSFELIFLKSQNGSLWRKSSKFQYWPSSRQTLQSLAGWYLLCCSPTQCRHSFSGTSQTNSSGFIWRLEVVTQSSMIGFPLPQCRKCNWLSNKFHHHD